jgi:hypothetical protein
MAGIPQAGIPDRGEALSCANVGRLDKPEDVEKSAILIPLLDSRGSEAQGKGRLPTGLQDSTMPHRLCRYTGLGIHGHIN